ncbi:MAG: DinB family protein [Chloroflexota bacterium]
MNKQDILLLYKYNQWSTKKILDAASRVTQEQFLAPAAFPHGGLRSTLVHALSAEWIWRQRWEGILPASHLRPEDFPTFESLRSRWVQEEKLTMTFAENVTEEKLNSKLSYKSLDGVPHAEILWQLIAHVVNHGTQHKTEAAAMLTDYGQSPGDIDMILFLRETD